MIKLLSIGNSFSQDAQRWLPDMLKEVGIDAYLVNLFIGGCSLETHWTNIDAEEPKAYRYQINAYDDSRTNLKDALVAEDWDIITFQQSSPLCGVEESYLPYLDQLVELVREYCPKAKFYMHETWAYEWGFERESFALHYNSDQREMYRKLKSAYTKMAERIGAELIPCGDVIQYIRENVPAFDYRNGGLSLNRDGYHLSQLYGRYAAGLVWLKTIFGGDPLKVENLRTYTMGATADPEILKMIRESVAEYLEK